MTATHPDSPRGSAALAPTWASPMPMHAPTGRFGHTERDLRSVGELLVDADYQARQLLFDVGQSDVAGLLRGWPRVAQSCLSVWGALHPQRPPLSLAPPDGLTRSEQAVSRALSSWPWPGPGPVDDRLTVISDQLGRAADLIGRLSDDIPYGRHDVEIDAGNVRSRATHTVYVAAHAVTVALRDHDHALRLRVVKHPTNRVSPGGASRQLERAGLWLATLDQVERRVGNVLTERPLVGSVFAPPPADRSERPDLERQTETLGAWDQRAHKALAAQPPRPADLALVSSTQAFIADAVGFLLTSATSPEFELAAPAAVVHALVRPRTRELTAAVADSARTWRSLARHWSELVPGPPRHDAGLAGAAGQTRAALRALTHDGGTTAPSPVLAERVGEDLVKLIGRALDQGAELARHLGDSVQDRSVRGPARQVSVLANNLAEDGLAPGAASADDKVWVGLNDVARNHQVSLPLPVSDWLASAARATSASAQRADQLCHDGLLAGPAADAATFAPVPGKDDSPVAARRTQLAQPAPGVVPAPSW